MPETSPAGSFEPALSKNYVPTPDTAPNYIWRGANFITVLGTTSLLVSGVRSLTEGILAEITKPGSLPPLSSGVSSVGAALFRGWWQMLGGTSVRSVYVSGTKNQHRSLESEHGSEESCDRGNKPLRPRGIKAQIAYAGLAALGDTMVTQVPDNITTLRKLNAIDPRRFPGLFAGLRGLAYGVKFQLLTPETFTDKRQVLQAIRARADLPIVCSNYWELARAALFAKYGAGVVNFFALCQLESQIANRIPMDEGVGKHLIAGGSSGILGAIASSPLSALRDKILQGCEVTEVKKTSYSIQVIRFPGVCTFVASNIQYVQAVGIAQACKEQAWYIVKRMPISALRSMGIFAVVAGVQEQMGSEPLQKLRQVASNYSQDSGFFSTTPGEVVAKKVEQDLRFLLA